MSAYSEKLRDPRWQRRRLAILERDSFACVVCGDTQTTLHVHHVAYVRGRDPWDYSERALVTLCETCHDCAHGKGSNAPQKRVRQQTAAEIMAGVTKPPKPRDYLRDRMDVLAARGFATPEDKNEYAGLLKILAQRSKEAERT